MASSMTRNSFWILTVLAQGRRHGYDIMRDVEALSKGRAVMKTTTLYAALERLEKTGLIAADGEEIVAGRARRYYRLTDEGGATLEEAVEELDELTSAARDSLAALKRTIRPVLSPRPWTADRVNRTLCVAWIAADVKGELA
ncbi:PadR family transcriptional regulator [Actinomyces mediterranea]|uniref:PadR family transcriptional regulator n=1 Tax=Actinomyces mediterranea TaxID=1871028 RepID=UPI000970D40D|nr:PadR family transcriptional regulator [Actinomyces mediterranea]